MKSDEIINGGDRNATLLNNFFINAITNLKMTVYSGVDPQAGNISHQSLKVIFILVYMLLKLLQQGESSISVCRDIMNEIRKLSTKIKHKESYPNHWYACKDVNPIQDQKAPKHRN